MSREQELGLDRSRKKFDVREEYFVSFHLFLWKGGSGMELLDLGRV